MSNDLIRRLEALERRLNAEQPAGLPPGGPLRVVIVHGCLPPGEPLFATAGGHEWLRASGEDLDAFADRVRAAALDLKASLLVIGGLPRSQAQQDLAMAAYDAWLLTDDGVPPLEPGRGIPA
ncbi:hypothetical protein JQ595_37345 [Bradyrhizobium japonicum]|uniref:hypothetical protein n=1 Tax=Bradyrhizobium japonicum TaxID=375 RepID=UPI001BABB305|nr:hypothetical protein [Bradyrhizobium japonicum]MBR0734428.1 hypothetical protein [Bradyrhizobium japonicum]